MGAHQRWFEPEWMYATGRDVAFFDHQRARACVVMGLSDTWEATRSGLKRNVKESIRRSNNRLDKSGHPWELLLQRGRDVDRVAVDRFLGLHRARSTTGRATVHHHDAFADRGTRQFMRDVLPELAQEGLATLLELVIEDRVVASQLVLHATRTSYVHSSGFDPAVWDLGPVTFLHSELVKHAIERGDTVVNFSPGPNVAKFRWSEDVVKW